MDPTEFATGACVAHDSVYSTPFWRASAGLHAALAPVLLITSLLFVVARLGGALFRGRLMPPKRHLRELLGSLRVQLRKYWGGTGARDTEVEKKVLEIADARHLNFYRMAFKVLWVNCTLYLLATGLQLAHAGAFSKLSSGELDLWSLAVALDRTTDFPMFTYFFASITPFVLIPRLLSKRTLYFWLALTMVRIHVPLARPVPWPLFMSISEKVLLSRLILNLFCTDIAFVIASQLLSSFLGMFLVQQMQQEAGVGCDSIVVMDQLIKGSWVAIVALYIRHLLLQQIRSTEDAKNSTEVQASIESLLKTMCDAVVHLRADLTLLAPSPQLDVLLLRRPAAPAGCESFLDFLPSDSDQLRFREFVRPRAQDGEVQGTLHMHMRDSSQTRVAVQVFHASYRSPLDELCHIVGIREAGDLGEGAPLPRFGRAAPVSLEVEAAADALRSRPAEREQGVLSETSSMLSGPDPLALAPQAECDAGEAAVWVYIYREGYPMQRCSLQFFYEFGSTPLHSGRQLISLVAKNTQRQFMEKVQGLFNDLASGHETQQEIEAGRVHFKLQHLAVEADMHLSLPPQVDGGPVTADDQLVKITFRHMRRRARKAARARSWREREGEERLVDARRDSLFPL